MLYQVLDGIILFKLIITMEVFYNIKLSGYKMVQIYLFLFVISYLFI
jgi:hypothetical protein